MFQKLNCSYSYYTILFFYRFRKAVDAALHFGYAFKGLQHLISSSCSLPYILTFTAYVAFAHLKEALNILALWHVSAIN